MHLSDLHCDARARLEPGLPAAVAALRPDVIAFTGDALNTPEGLEHFRQTMTALARLAPTFVVRGNWDVWFWSRLDLYGGTGVTVLDSRSVELAVRGQRVRLTGVPVGDVRALPRLLAGLDPGALDVFLHHYPDELERVAGSTVDLYLAGHTHGGQVALPLYGALVTFSRFGKRFERGLYREGGVWMYVTRGVGMEGGPAPRVRFWARPELSVLDVVGEGEGEAGNRYQ